MASNNTRNQQQNNNNEEKGGGWLLPAAIGMAVGAGLAYMLGKSEQSENCSRSRYENFVYYSKRQDMSGLLIFYCLF